MTTIINAVTGTGLTQTADTSGIIKLQSNGVTTNALAWCNFNGTSSGTITPRANYNISSVTKNGTGDYTCNFTSALSDANYSVVSMGGRNPDGSGGENGSWNYVDRYSTSSARVLARTSAGFFDQPTMFVAVFGN